MVPAVGKCSSCAAHADKHDSVQSTPPDRGCADNVCSVPPRRPGDHAGCPLGAADNRRPGLGGAVREAGRPVEDLPRWRERSGDQVRHLVTGFYQREHVRLVGLIGAVLE